MGKNQLWKVASDMTPPWLDMIVTVFIATLASTGFWSFIQSKSNKKSNTDELILGLAHDRIVRLGSEYLKTRLDQQLRVPELHKVLMKSI